MPDTPVPVRRRPVPVLVTAVLGLVGGALAALASFSVFALGGLDAEDGTGRWWVLALFLVAVGQVWGAVRLLLGRGWLLLALASLPGVLPLVALVVIWTEYHQRIGLLEVLATLPVLTLALTLTPPVRRWATAGGSDVRAPQDVTTSRA